MKVRIAFRMGTTPTGEGCTRKECREILAETAKLEKKLLETFVPGLKKFFNISSNPKFNGLYSRCHTLLSFEGDAGATLFRVKQFLRAQLPDAEIRIERNDIVLVNLPSLEAV